MEIPNISTYPQTTSEDLPCIGSSLPSTWVMLGRHRLLLLAAVVAIFRGLAMHAETNCQRSSFSTTSSVWGAAQPIWMTAEESRLGNRHLLQVYQEMLMKAECWPWLVHSVALMSVLLWQSCCWKYEHSALIVPQAWVNWWWLTISSRT